MKLKLLSISLLFTWIFQIGFPYAQYELRRRECWQNFLNKKSQFTAAEIQKIDFSEEIKWERKEKEFRLNGNFYDVIKIEKGKGKKLIYCVADKDEDAILRAYENYLQKHQKEKSQKLQKPAYFLENPVTFTFKNPYLSKFQFFYSSSKGINFCEVISPPPDLWS